MPSTSVASPPITAPKALIKSSQSLPVSGTAAFSLAEPVADVTREQQASINNSTGAAFARASSQVVEEPNPDVA